MHEWALAEGVFATALKAAEQQGMTRIEKIVVKIGELQQIQKELFEQALQQVAPAAETRIEAAEIVLELEKALFRCRACGRAFSFADATSRLGAEEAEAIHFVPELAHTCIGCPECGSPDFEVGAGRGVWIERIEGI